MLAGASGLVAERLTDHLARKHIGMPIWAFAASSFGLYFVSHAVGIGISHSIDPKHGSRRYRETSDEIYQQFNIPSQLSGTERYHDRVNLLTKGITIVQALYSLIPQSSGRPEHFNDPSHFYMN